MGKLAPSILVIRTPGSSLNEITISSPTPSRQHPKTSNPHETLATVAGAKTLIDFMVYFLPILIISAKIPDAVTAAPAPAPLTIKGCSA